MPRIRIFNVILLAAALLLMGSAAAQSGKTIQESMDINIEADESGNYSLDLGQEANITSVSVSGFVSQNGSARVYIESEEGKKLIFDSKRPLFDINVVVLPEYKSVFPGQEALIDISIFNLRGFGKIDALVDYQIRNSQNKILGSTTENITIETKAKFIRNLAVPEGLIPGSYLAFVGISMGNSSLGSSSDSFEVKEPEAKKPVKDDQFILNASLVAMLLILVSITIIYWLSKKPKISSTPESRTDSLRKKLKSLEAAYKVKSISKGSYEKTREAINEEIGEIEKKRK